MQVKIVELLEYYYKYVVMHNPSMCDEHVIPVTPSQNWDMGIILHNIIWAPM